MRIFILGAGAIGCYVGGRLAASKQNVTLIGRPRIIDKLSLGGLRVTTNDGFDVTNKSEDLQLATSLSAALKEKPQQNGEQIAILVCTKSTATIDAGLEIAKSEILDPIVVSLQNGAENAQRLRDNEPNAKVYAGMVPFTIGWRGDNHVFLANSGNLQIEESGATNELATNLRAAGVGVDLHKDMLGILWGKLLINLLNPINALANIPIRAQLLDRDYRKALAAAQIEGLGVLSAAGIKPAKVSAAPPAIIPKILRLPNWLFIRIAKSMLSMDPEAKTSMCQDLQSGRPTEVDDLCGAIVRLGTKHGVATPINQKLMELVQNYKIGDDWNAKRLKDSLGI